MAHTESRLLRFFNQSPSFLDTPENRDLFRERAAARFGPREVDEGRPSYWEARTEVDSARHAAYNASRASKPRSFNALSLARQFIAEHDFDPRNETDPAAPACIAHLHCTVDATTAEKMDAFVETLRAELEALQAASDANDGDRNVAYIKYTKASLKGTVTEALESCPGLDISKTPKWIRQLAEATSS